ncbi:hypothetical protein GGI20_000600 [Coemansia sp. BCRC 34301]|nr:hypothetical protein GGI20_000600 [Coemansia sp. BCRC 34301]
MDYLFARATDVNEIFDPSKVPGSSVYLATNGTDLGMQAIFAASFFTIFILLFSALRLRWPYIFSPRTRLTITAPPFLSKRFFGWFLATMRTPETHILNTLGLDAVIFLRFYKMCMRLLLDIAFFSIAIIWPINIVWSKTNLNPQTSKGASPSSGDQGITLTYSVMDYLFNLTLDTSDPKQKWNLVPHIFFVYVFSGLAYYHISKFSSRWASLRWHFLMQSRHALVSRTVMLTGVPRHLARSPRELEWFWGAGVQLGKVEKVRVCPFNTRLTSSARARARYLVNLEHAYMQLLGNPCEHPEYDPERLKGLAMDPSEPAREEERSLLAKWAKPGRRRRKARRPASSSAEAATPDSGEKQGEAEQVKRPHIWVRTSGSIWKPWGRVDAIDYWRGKFLEADASFRQLRSTLDRSEDDQGRSTTAFVTFEDAASAHMATQLSCYPNPGYMKARLAPEPRGVYWPNVWISSRRKWAGFMLKWACIFVIWAFWSVPVILFSSLLTPESLGKIFPSVLSADHSLLRSFLSSTVPSVFLLLFLNMLPWILKQVHFVTGVRTKPDIDYSVMTKMWAFLVFNVILVFGFSGTFWIQILNVVNNPGTVMQNLASNIPRVGTFFTGYILVLGVGYQPFKLLQLRPVVWHIGRQWLCSTPRDYARLVSPVYIDWYSVYPYPLLVFGIAMVYSTFSPPVVVGAVIYFVIGYPVMKYLLLYVYFHPFETAGMAWPKVCRRMILSVILYQVVILTFVVVKGGGWYTFSMVPIIMLYMWFFYFVGWSLEKQGTVLPVYLWRNPPPNSSYPLPPYGSGVEMEKEYDSPYAGPVRSESLAKPQHLFGPSGSNARPPVARQCMGSLAAQRQPLRTAARIGKRAASGHHRRESSRGRAASGHHRRESSRGVRTREIILAGRSKPAGLPPGKRSGSEVGRPPVAGSVRGPLRKASAGSFARPRGPKGRYSPSSSSSSSRWQRKRYKSLAEAATVEGSRLIMSLGKLPSELYSRHTESRRNSGVGSDVAAAGRSKRWSSLSGKLQAFGRSSKDSADGLPLALEERGGAPDSAVCSTADAVVRRGTGRVRSHSPLANEAGADDGEWSDEDEGPGVPAWQQRGEWDPLVYLNQGSRTIGATLGTLLTDVGRSQTMPPPPLQRVYASNIAAAVASDYPDSASSGLRQRRALGSVSSGEYASRAASEAGSHVAASIIEAEGTQRKAASRVRATLRQIRDYFLADFRPAGPILDLTYDRMYSQGIDEGVRVSANGEPVQDNGDSMPPLRELLGHVLPRSMSRSFLGPPPEAASPPPVAPLPASAPVDALPVANPITRIRSAAATATATAGTFPGRYSHRQSGSVQVGVVSPPLWAQPGSFQPGPSQPGPSQPGPSQPGPRLIAHSRHHSESPHGPPARWSPDDARPLPWSANDAPDPLLPRPPRAPWMLSAEASPPTLPSSSSSVASHKNSLPPPRLPLPARVVSGLNYTTRLTTTPAFTRPNWLLSPETVDPSSDDQQQQQQLLIANYQRFAVEAQSTFEPDEFTDYEQTPMLNFRGILDRGIRDYVHPGLVGELPTLWLPVKAMPKAESFPSPPPLPRESPRHGVATRCLSKLLHHRSKSNTAVAALSGVSEGAGYTELTEVRVEDQPSNRGSQMAALTPILEVVTPRSSICVKSPNLSSSEASGDGGELGFRTMSIDK